MALKTIAKPSSTMTAEKEAVIPPVSRCFRILLRFRLMLSYYVKKNFEIEQKDFKVSAYTVLLISQEINCSFLIHSSNLCCHFGYKDIIKMGNYKPCVS